MAQGSRNMQETNYKKLEVSPWTQYYTAELGYNVMKGTENFVSL
jgi:hypothetical protein